MAIKDDVKTLKREKILEEAIRLFSLRGFRGTTMEAVAEALEVTKPYLYGVYEKKTDILVDIYLRTVQRCLVTVQQALSLPGSPSDRLRWFARTFTGVVISDKAAVAVYFQEEPSVPEKDRKQINGLKKEFDDLLASLLQQGIDDGSFVVGDLRLATLAIGGMMNWIYTWYSPNGRLAPDEIADSMADYALRVAQADSSRPTPRRARSSTRT